MGLLVAGSGWPCWSCRRGCRRPAGTRLAGSAPGSWSAGWRRVVATDIVLPAFGGGPGFYWSYGQFGPSVPSAVWHVADPPARHGGDVRCSPEVKVRDDGGAADLAAFASLLSPYLLVAAATGRTDAVRRAELVGHGVPLQRVPGGAAALRRGRRDGRVRRWSAAVDRRGGVAGGGRLGGRLGGGVLVLARVHGAVLRVRTAAVRLVLAADGGMRAARRSPSRTCRPGSPSRRPTRSARALTGRDHRTAVGPAPRAGRRGWSPTRRPRCSRSARSRQQRHERRPLRPRVPGGLPVDGYLVLHHPGPLPPLVTAQSPGC